MSDEFQENPHSAAHREAAEALRESQARLAAIANLVPDLIWSSDPAGYTDWCNQRWLEYTGLTSEQAGASGWLAAVHPDDRATSRRVFQAAADRGEPLRHEHRIRSATGEYRWFLVQARPLRDEMGKIVRWFGAATDIHEQRLALAALEDAQADLELRVNERTQELQELSHTRQVLLQRLVTVQEDERQRIARELHDTLGQFLSAIGLRLTLLQQNPALDPAVRAEIEQLRPVVRQLDQELHRLTMQLRPPALDDLGLPDALRQYAREWAQTAGIPVDVVDTGFWGGLAAESEGPPRFAEPVESAIFRIVQEALTNVLKHARASAVSILLEQRRDELRLVIEDNGVGFNPQAPAHRRSGRRRLGLVGMQERATLAGGGLEIESAPGAGTTIYVRIPL